VALVTLVFPDSAPGSFRASPQPHAINIPSNSSAKSLPCSSNRLSPISYDSNLAFSMPFDEVSNFLLSMQELPVAEAVSEERYLDHNGSSEKKKWIMKAVRNPGSLGIRKRAYEMWTDFLDLLKVYLLRFGEIICANSI
jgi:hydroxymethylglutaryl-CoA reductase (NADPH)